jgi:acetoin utilization protein AcuB
MFISKRMVTNLVTVTQDTLIGQAIHLMEQHTIRHLPVIDQEERLVGIVSDRDMRTAMPSSLLSRPLYESALAEVLQYPVSEIMTENPLTISLYYTIQDTLLVMGKKKVGALPVVDEQGHLRGILSTRDLLRAFVNVMGIGEPGTLLCILSEERTGQMKKVIDIITDENVSLGSVLVARYWDEGKRAIFPYLLTNNVLTIKQKLVAAGFELIDPMKWYLDQLPKRE